MNFVRKLWPRHKAVTVSLALSVAEVVLVWGSVLFIPHIEHHQKALADLATAAWILGSLGSFASAALALIVDRRWQLPLLALGVAIATWMICGLPMLV